MLTHITENFYIDFNEIYLIDKPNNELRVFVKHYEKPFLLLFESVDCYEFLKKLDLHLKTQDKI